MKKLISNHYFNLVIKSILAGLFMALAGFELVAAKALNMYYLGGFVQGLGLLTIMYLGLEFFNTKICSIFDSKNKWKTALDILIVLVINIGTIIAVAQILHVMTLGNEPLIKAAEEIADYRVISIRQGRGKEWYDSLIASLFCGMIVATGVNIYRRTNNVAIRILSIICATGIYVICGFEQVMTNTFYIAYSNTGSASTIINILIVTLGNSLGGIAIYFAFKLLKPIKEIKNK